MADFTLLNGDEITFDLDKLTLSEWQGMKNPAFAQKEEYEIISRMTGIEVENISKMTMGEYKRLFRKLMDKIRNPLSDPN